MAEEVVTGRRLDWRGHLVGPFRRRAIDGLVERGYNRADAEELVGQIGDGKILEWILTHGPEIVAFIEMIIALFPK